MQNHAHKLPVEATEPFLAGDLFAHVLPPPSQKAVRVLEFPGSAIRSSSQASERIALDDGWKFGPGDPIDARGLAFAGRQRLNSFAADLLSPLEDDASPVIRRSNKADERLGCDISWVRPEFVDSDWVVVSLSDAAREQAHGVRAGWYRRTFESLATDEGRDIGLEMIGGFGQCIVWLNGQCVGRQGVGSTGLRRDLTPFIHVGGSNTLVIRVEDCNVPNEEATLARSISLLKRDALHLGQSGSSVKGVLRSGDRADLTISIILHNKHENARRGKLCCTLLDPAGRALADAEGDFHIFGRDRNLLQLKLTADDASWLAENPSRYLIRTRLVLNEGLLEEEISPFDLHAALSDDFKVEFSSKVC